MIDKKELKKLQKQHKDMGKEIERLHRVSEEGNKKRIDFSKLPPNTIMRMRDSNGREGHVRHFAGTCGGRVTGFSAGLSIYTTQDQGRVGWNQGKLLEGPVTAWLGGDTCPLPDGVEVTAHYRDRESRRVTLPESLSRCPSVKQEDCWSHWGRYDDIVAYQIHESEWQE